MKSIVRFNLTTLLTLLAVPAALAASIPSRELQFNRDIRPILTDNCFQCHGPDPAARKAGLRLDRDTGLFGKTDNGIATEPGKPMGSDVYLRMIADDEADLMPPPKARKHVTVEQKELVKAWIQQGAKWQSHWSLIAPERGTEPAVKNAGWVRNPIDRLVLAKLEANDLTPAAEADRRTLARRLSLDLIGLTPEPAEVEAFVADRSPDAYEKLVDRWLASPRYGEHRARYWLDAARYADTHGLHFDNYRQMWPYRQWVIEAFNRNQPFDRFTVEQLAGDLLPNRTLDQQIASGFHRCNVTSNEGGAITAELEANYAKDRVETTTAVWLGLTSQCATCHDHKFDPITTKEVYSFSAYFRNTVQPAFDGNISDTPPILIVPPLDRRARWEQIPKRTNELKKLIQKDRVQSAAAFVGRLKQGSTVSGESAATVRWGSGPVWFDKVSPALTGEMAALDVERQNIRQVSAVTLVMQEKADATPTARVLYRGQYDQPREEVKPAVFAALHPMAKDAPANRLGLANWIIDPKNPLMARVTVNRFWQEIFGTGIVKTTEDFGIMGEPPVNAALLDWMAVEFRESGWDVKHMIRLMVTSATYRQSAVVTPDKLQMDPANRWLSHGPRFRMDAEMVRDAALAASGLLVEKIGGPSVKPYQPDGVWEVVGMPDSDTRHYKQDTGEGLYRRSLYTFWKRSGPPASMDVFNAPTRENCTVRRERTDTPLQALVTLNDTQFMEAARTLAQHAIKTGEGFESRSNFVFERVLARPMHASEVSVCRAAVEDLRAYYQAHPEDAKQLLGVGESKRDASIDPATHAAWTMLANQVMNLDEALNK